MTRFSCASLAMVYPLGQYSRHHGGVCTWRSANLRDTPCRGDVSSAVITVSKLNNEVLNPHLSPASAPSFRWMTGCGSAVVRAAYLQRSVGAAGEGAACAPAARRAIPVPRVSSQERTTV